MEKYDDKLRGEIRKAIVIDFKSVTAVAKKFKVDNSCIYKWMRNEKWVDEIKEQCKTMFLDEKMKIHDIAKRVGRTVARIKKWKAEGDWDAEVRIFGSISLAREVEKIYLKTVQAAVNDGDLASSEKTNQIAKLMKVVESLNPQRFQLGNIFNLLRDLTDVVLVLGDDDFSNLFQKYLPEMADLLRDKYEPK